VVTIYDIAKQAKTSAVTVSLALRNSKRVSEATREKIHKIARKHGYRPNPLARGLVGARTKTLAFVFNFSSVDLSQDLSYMEYFHAIAQAAADKEYKIYFHSSNVALPIEELISDISHHRVDGMILGTELDEQERKILKETDIPTVIVGKDICSDKLTGVFTDDEDGIKQVVKHLLSLGHQRIAFVGKNNSETSIARYSGYCSTLKEANIRIDENLVIESDYHMDFGRQAGVQLAKLENRPSAIVAASDQLAIGIIAGLRSRGFKVPEDISVTGYDNLHIAQFTSPTLTTVDLLRSESAKTIIDVLFDMIEKQGTGKRIMTPVKLIVRESTRKI